ncbi:MAG: hypothetical protein R2880_11760 [Deinococcales bacterium]
MYQRLDPSHDPEDRTSLQKHLQASADKPVSAIIAINDTIVDKLIADLRFLNSDERFSPKRFQLASFSHDVKQHPYLACLAVQPGEALGKQAVEVVVDRLEHKLPPQPQHITIPMQILDLQTVP